MKQITKINLSELSEMSERMYGHLVKAVVDVSKKIIVVDAEMHVDLEQYLLNSGSKQSDLWGINLYPYKFNSDDFIEFDSIINIRPRVKNYSRGVEDINIQQKIRAVVSGVVYE